MKNYVVSMREERTRLRFGGPQWIHPRTSIPGHSVGQVSWLTEDVLSEGESSQLLCWPLIMSPVQCPLLPAVTEHPPFWQEKAKRIDKKSSKPHTFFRVNKQEEKTNPTTPVPCMNGMCSTSSFPHRTLLTHMVSYCHLPWSVRLDGVARKVNTFSINQTYRQKLTRRCILFLTASSKVSIFSPGQQNTIILSFNYKFLSGAIIQKIRSPTIYDPVHNSYMCSSAEYISKGKETSSLKRHPHSHVYCSTVKNT